MRREHGKLLKPPRLSQGTVLLERIFKDRDLQPNSLRKEGEKEDETVKHLQCFCPRGRRPKASTWKRILRGIRRANKCGHSTIEKSCPGIEMTKGSKKEKL